MSADWVGFDWQAIQGTDTVIDTNTKGDAINSGIECSYRSSSCMRSFQGLLEKLPGNCAGFSKAQIGLIEKSGDFKGSNIWSVGEGRGRNHSSFNETTATPSGYQAGWWLSVAHGHVAARK